MKRFRLGRHLVVREVVWAVIPLVVTLLIWQIAALTVPTNSYFEGPMRAIGFLGSGDNITAVVAAFRSTLWFVLLGYLVGVGFAVMLACAFVLWGRLETALSPFVVLVGTVPIIVVTPLLTLVLGRGISVSVTVCAIVTFFPGLVNVRAGLGQTDSANLDAFRALGASRWKILTSLRLPGAVPSILTASKLSLPGALGGVLLVEIIATGQGIGQYITSARALLNYDEMWAGVLSVAVVAVVLYAFVAAAEAVLMVRFAPERLGHMQVVS